MYVADIDRQNSLDADQVTPYALEKTTLSALLNALPTLDKTFDYILIDAAGKLDTDLPADRQEISRLLFVVDVLAIPVTPGNFTLAATLEYVKLAKMIQAKRGVKHPLRIMTFVNQAEPNTRDDKELRLQLTELAALAKIDVLTASLPRYAAFRAMGLKTRLAPFLPSYAK